MITVIIPSKGRDTLKFSLFSLLQQTNSDWKCIVAFDNIDQQQISLIDDHRIKYIFLDAKAGDGVNGGGAVRNAAIEIAKTEWICFLDDDDTFTVDYIDKFYQELSENTMDVCIFKMIYKNGAYLPPRGLKELIKGQVGISFAVNLTFLNEKKLRFINGATEDFNLLIDLQNNGANIHFSESICYQVGFSSI
jgi:glycosyltransferase involved in cell wall biosynthesis